MVPTVPGGGSGTITPSLNTETFLYNPNVAGTYVLVIDTSNMAAGDGLTINVYATLLSGGNPSKLYSWTISGGQSVPVWISVPVPNDLGTSGNPVTNALRFSITQSGSVAKAFPWKVLQL